MYRVVARVILWVLVGVHHHHHHHHHKKKTNGDGTNPDDNPMVFEIELTGIEVKVRIHSEEERTSAAELDGLLADVSA